MINSEPLVNLVSDILKDEAKKLSLNEKQIADVLDLRANLYEETSFQKENHKIDEIIVDNMYLSFRIQHGLIEARFIKVISGRGI